MIGAPLGVRAAFLVEYLDLPAATGDEAATWEAYQLMMLSDEGTFSTYRKSRQIGWSFTAACDVVANAIIEPGSTAIFVSINREEATEKIRYSKGIIEALDDDVRPEVEFDSQSKIELGNKSRILSHPNRPVRGRARARVYLDEFAHSARDREIYASTLPVVTRGGVVRIGSTPLGASGVFHDIVSQTSRPYPGYRRFSVPWWCVNATCNDVDEALVVAVGLPTQSRVEQFGSARLKEIFDNMALEDFQQEYECNWTDENVAFIAWDEIKKAQAAAQYDHTKNVSWDAKDVSSGLAAIEDLAAAAEEGKVEGLFYGGLDIGRRHDLTEFTVLGKTTTDQLVYRLRVGLSNVPFDDQEAVIASAMDRLRLARLCVDETGMGMQFAERLTFRYGRRVLPITFTNNSKAEMAMGVKLRLQKGQLLLSADRDLATQVHSIKRQVTPSKNLVFDVARSERHHADRFWSLALACLAAKGPQGVFFR